MIIDIEESFNDSFYDSAEDGCCSNRLGVNIHKLIDYTFLLCKMSNIFKACDISLLKSELTIECLEVFNAMINTRLVYTIKNPYSYFSYICYSNAKRFISERAGDNPRFDIYGKNLLIKRSGISGVDSEYANIKQLSEYEDY